MRLLWLDICLINIFFIFRFNKNGIVSCECWSIMYLRFSGILKMIKDDKNTCDDDDGDDEYNSTDDDN